MPDPGTWLRLSPLSRDPALDDGLAARVADPLWLLARQLTFGEFDGFDGGSPITTSLTADRSRLTRVRSDDRSGPGTPLEPGVPLEFAVESEDEPPAGPITRPIAAALAGLALQRMLRASAGLGTAEAVAAYAAALTEQYPLTSVAPPAGTPGPPPPTGSEPLLRTLRGRAPDGQGLYAALAGLRADPPVALPDHPDRTDLDDQILTATMLAWLNYVDATSSTRATASSGSAWRPDRLEYGLSAAAPGPGAETVLHTGEHVGGDLDWYSFDLVASARAPLPSGAPALLGAAGDDNGPATIALDAIPTPARFAGMPEPRWWTFEDAVLNLGQVVPRTENAITLVVLDYLLRYANDHYVLPVRLDLGSLCRARSLVVTTTFNERVLVAPIADLEPDGPFRLFEPSLPGDRDLLIVLLPTIAHSISGPPIEHVRYQRDDLAELVWAIEETVLDPVGRPADRSAAARIKAGGTLPEPAAETGTNTQPVWRYMLRTALEANWFPFTGPDPADGAAHLQFAPVPPTGEDGPAPLPWGRILAEQISSGLVREEVTGSGLTVTRRWRYARWTDGRHLIWVARQVQPGAGEAHSGLAFDLAVPTTTTPWS